MILLDSSHEYLAMVQEIELWYQSRTMDLPRPFYKDACGLRLIQKAGLPAPIHNDAGSMRRP